MNKQPRHTSELESGIFFTAIGLAVVYLSSSYNMGSAVRMGPGYFPFLLGCLLSVLGAIILVRSLVKRGYERPVPFDVRSVAVVAGSIILFGVALPILGMVIAIPAFVIIVSLAPGKVDWRATLFIALVLTVFCYLIFAVGLGLRIPLFPEFG